MTTRKGLEGQPLTDDERKTLLLAAQGHTVAATAAKLFVSADAVKSRRRNAMRKLQAASMEHAVGIAYRTGVLPVDPVAELVDVHVFDLAGAHECFTGTIDELRAGIVTEAPPDFQGPFQVVTDGLPIFMRNRAHHPDHDRETCFRETIEELRAEREGSDAGASDSCGASLSARCFNGAAGCRVHPQRCAEHPDGCAPLFEGELPHKSDYGVNGHPGGAIDQDAGRVLCYGLDVPHAHGLHPDQCHCCAEHRRQVQAAAARPIFGDPR